MGDPLSIAAGAAGLLSLGLQSTEYLYNFYIAFRDQHQELARITDHLGSLLESLQIIDEILRVRTRRSNEQSIIQNIETSITRSEDIIHALQDESNKFKKEPADNWKEKAVIVGRRAAYPFKRSTVEDLGDDVNDFRDNLSVALQALQLKEHQNTQNDIGAVATIVKNLQAQTGSTDLRQWLSAPDATIDLNIASAKRYTGTGQWLVHGTAYNA
jgi:ribosomal protein L18